MAIAIVAAAVIIGAGIDLTISRFQPPGPVITSIPTSSSTTSTSGIRLEESINASSIIGFQGLNISVSLLNTRQSVNSVQTANDWYFTGVPISLWGVDDGGAPASVLVLRGNYTIQQLRAGQNVTTSFVSSCGGITNNVIFPPDGDEANASGMYGCSGMTQQTLGPFKTAFSFTADGGWDTPAFEKQLNPPILGPNEQQPTPVYTAFFPGVYTIAASDEWGQAIVLHVTVLAPQTSTVSSTSALPTPAEACHQGVLQSNTSSAVELNVTQDFDTWTWGAFPSFDVGSYTFTVSAPQSTQSQVYLWPKVNVDATNGLGQTQTSTVVNFGTLGYPYGPEWPPRLQGYNSTLFGGDVTIEWLFPCNSQNVILEVMAN